MTQGANEVIVVGAGLAGLTAALNLARDGKDVLVLEKYDKIGGVPVQHPAVDVTPMEADRLGRFIGVDLGPPQVNDCENWNQYMFDYPVRMDLTYVNLKCVERGPQDTSIDTLLYENCLEAGVKFEFGKPCITPGDFARLPADSIIATGLLYEAFEALHVPYQKVFGYFGRGKTDKGNVCAVWFHDYVMDYSYYGAANGKVFALYFAREPVRDSEYDEWKEKLLYGQEGITCDSWHYHEGLVPTACYGNPRMFAGDKILAGTLAGMMDPFALFGVHGSLVSGKIAAMAHSDKAAAYALFKEYTKLFNRNLFIKRFFDHSPVALKKRTMGPQLKFVQEHPGTFKGFMDNFFRAIPGYRRLPD